jgi:hypothetical protein
VSSPTLPCSDVKCCLPFRVCAPAKGDEQRRRYHHHAQLRAATNAAPEEVRPVQQ